MHGVLWNKGDADQKRNSFLIQITHQLSSISWPFLFCWKVGYSLIFVFYGIKHQLLIRTIFIDFI